MRFYNIDAKGKFLLPRGNSLPAGTGPEDEGRAFYRTSDGKLYLNNGGSWEIIPGEYADVPAGTTLLIEADSAITGYSLLTDQDDDVVYITKGSGAGGQVGGSAKTAGTWTQPNHSHSISASGTHTHTMTISGYTGVPDAVGLYDILQTNNTGNLTRATTTPQSGSGGNHTHGGATGAEATVDTWRPKGRNFTRQQRM